MGGACGEGVGVQVFLILMDILNKGVGCLTFFCNQLISFWAGSLYMVVCDDGEGGGVGEIGVGVGGGGRGRLVVGGMKVPVIMNYYISM